MHKAIHNYEYNGRVHDVCSLYNFVKDYSLQKKIEKEASSFKVYLNCAKTGLICRFFLNSSILSASSSISS